jgi:APA family basic amino acid/polyamine antiporter
MSDRVIGLTGAVATVTGFVIGVSVFVLPGALAASAGPAVLVTYCLASALGLLACVVAAHVGLLFPKSGASFVAVHEVLGPLWGFLLVWLLVGASAVGVGLLAFGLADYLATVVAVDRSLVALLSVVLLAGVNVAGAQASVRSQSVFVVLFLAALVVFVAGGLPQIEVDLLTPFVPNGWAPVLLAVLPAYFSYAGFMVIVELAGEIRRPERTIPLALAISFVVVLATYVLVALTLVGLVPWQELQAEAAPVAKAAAQVFPAGFAAAIALTAVAAAASSINGILLGYSRDVRALAESGLLPARLQLRAAWMPPQAAGVLPIAAVAVVAVLVGPDIEALAIQTVVGVLLVQCLLAAALLRLVLRDPQALERLPARSTPAVAVVFSVGLLLTSAGACIAVLATGGMQLLISSLYCLIGVLIYCWQRSRRSGQSR